MKIVLVDERITTSIERGLMHLGLTPIKLPQDRCLGEAVKSHPDTLMFYNNGHLVTTADYCEVGAYIFSDIREYCRSVKISFTSDTRAATYPDDAKLNALAIGDKIFCNTSVVSRWIIDYAKACGLCLVHVNQGYPACTTLAFGDRAITADQGMARVLSDNGFKLLTIEPGHISLPPHEYGFIGGASLVYDNKVCFFGNIDLHPDGKRIREFITEGGYEIVSLSTDPLVDFGGGIIL